MERRKVKGTTMAQHICRKERCFPPRAQSARHASAVITYVAQRQPDFAFTASTGAVSEEASPAEGTGMYQEGDVFAAFSEPASCRPHRLAIRAPSSCLASGKLSDTTPDNLTPIQAVVEPWSAS